jgi:hypothetical protein
MINGISDTTSALSSYAFQAQGTFPDLNPTAGGATVAPGAPSATTAPATASAVPARASAAGSPASHHHHRRSGPSVNGQGPGSLVDQLLQQYADPSATTSTVSTTA